MVMERARGLFHRAVCESGFAFSLKSPEEAELYATGLIAELGGSDVSAATAASMPELLAAQVRLAAKQEGDTLGAIGPVLDGNVFAETPGQAWDRGHGSAVPLLAGWTLDEVTLLGGQDIDASIPVPDMFRAPPPDGQRAAFDPSAGGLAAISYWGGGDATAVIAARRALFPAESDAVLARRLLSDIMFRRPQERVALARAAAGSATYLYRFEWASPVMRPLGAPHCAGIAPFFANDQLVAFTRDNPDAHALAETMSSALSAFMRTGDPASPGRSWPRYQCGHAGGHDLRPAVARSARPRTERAHCPRGAESKVATVSRREIQNPDSERTRGFAWLVSASRSFIPNGPGRLPNGHTTSVFATTNWEPWTLPGRQDARKSPWAGAGTPGSAIRAGRPQAVHSAWSIAQSTWCCR